MCIRTFFPVPGLLLLFSRADALFGYGLLRCQFTSSKDNVYLEQIYFNKVLMVQYNSTLGKYTGYTEKAKEIADDLNKNPSFLRQVKKNALECEQVIPQALGIFSTPVEPSISLKTIKPERSNHPATLLCSVFNFYPKQIRVTWLRNGEEVTSDVTSTEELPNGNWLYQIHSYLEYTPRLGEKVSCKVEHASLAEPRLYDWELLTESERNKFAVGSVGLLMGLVFLVAGLIYYKKNNAGRVLVPTG